MVLVFYVCVFVCFIQSTLCIISMYVCLFTLFIVVNNIVILYSSCIMKCLYSTCNACIRKDCLCVSIFRTLVHVMSGINLFVC